MHCDSDVVLYCLNEFTLDLLSIVLFLPPSLTQFPCKISAAIFSANASKIKTTD